MRLRTTAVWVGVCLCTVVSCSSGDEDSAEPDLPAGPPTIELGSAIRLELLVPQGRESGDSLAVVTGTIVNPGDSRGCARVEILKTEGQTVRSFSQPVAEGFSVDIKRPEAPESAAWQTLAAADLNALGIKCVDGRRRRRPKE